MGNAQAIQPLASSVGTSPKERFLAAIGRVQGLTQVESLISSKLASEAPKLSEIAAYLQQLGGKRVRPVLTILAAKAVGLSLPSNQVVEVAAGIELIHMATLLHDDIIDKSPLRRHRASPFVRYGVDDTLITGDFLLTRAFGLCSRLDRFVIEETEKACIELTEGEILEVPLCREGNPLPTLENYLTVARKKTASLFRLAALCGSHLAGASDEACRALGAFGEDLGIAFQILDDLLDVTAEETLLGKRSGMDLRERKPSVINILWIESGSALSKTLMNVPAENEDLFAEAALKELRTSVVLDQTTKLAEQFAASALKNLERARSLVSHPDHGTFDDLAAMAEYTVSRNS